MYCNHAPRTIKKPVIKKVKNYHPNIVAIFQKLYRVRMYARDTIPIEEQRTRGTVVTGNRGIDKAMENSYTFPYICIADMVNYFVDGIPIFITEESDTKKIYEAVCNHTGTWRTVLANSYNLGEAPLEDLIAMENFVSVIYQKAKFEYLKRPEKAASSGSLADFLYNGSNLRGISYGSNNQLVSSYKERSRAMIDDHKHEPNISVFRDVLMSSMGGGNGPREL